MSARSYTSAARAGVTRSSPLPADPDHPDPAKATVIPVRVFNDYTISLPGCDGPTVVQGQVNFGTDASVVAGIE